MNAPDQALAYARADFAEPHNHFIELFRSRHAHAEPRWVLDLGCGPGDICRRFARAYPACRIHGIDGAPAMLELGRQENRAASLEDRIELIETYLPAIHLPRKQYDTLISNSLLHHLADPAVLWSSLRHFGAPEAAVFVMDLLRPDSPAAAHQLVDTYAGNEPPILQHDFYHSLCAAYTPDEVQAQLDAAGLAQLELEVISDRHWIVYGQL